jgi:hypothetical protein
MLLGIPQAKRPRGTSPEAAVNVSIDCRYLVGARGFEPSASWSRTRKGRRIIDLAIYCESVLLIAK